MFVGYLPGDLATTSGLPLPTSDPFASTLVAAQAGEAWAFRRLYEPLAPTVTAYLRLRGARDPEDVTSETFLAVFRNLDRFEGDESQFRSWVFTIAHRRLIDTHRRWARRAPDVPFDPERTEVVGGDVEEEALAPVLDPRTRAALVRLTDDQRTVVLLRILGDLSVAEVAEVTGKRPGTVRNLQHRALARLRRELSAAHPDRASVPGARGDDS